MRRVARAAFEACIGLDWGEDAIVHEIARQILRSLRPKLADGATLRFVDHAEMLARWCCQTNLPAVPLAMVTSRYEQPVPIFQQFAGGHSSGRDDVREISAVAAQR